MPHGSLPQSLHLLLVSCLIPLSSPCSFLVSSHPPPPDANHLQSRRGPDSTTSSHHAGLTWTHNLLHMTGPFTPQPFEDADIVATYNGEIYNAADYAPNNLSDGSSLIPAYKDHGPSFPSYLDGEFALVLLDGGSSTLVLATDVFGTKPLHYSISGSHIVVASYESAVRRTLRHHGMPTSGIKKLEPNTILTFDVDSRKLLTNSTTHTFSLSQSKTNYDDFAAAFHSSIVKRTSRLHTSPFVGLSSGYDSGAIACALANHSIPSHALTISGMEDHRIVGSRVEYMSSRGALLTNKTMRMSMEAYQSQQFELQALCEPSTYPSNLGYNTEGPMDMRTDPGAIGLSLLCHTARSLDSLVYISGTGADEIMSDYGFNGTKYTPHSSFGGLFPTELSPVFPWYNFFGGTQSAYLMKEEYVAGTYGLEARYPFLDKALVQEFLSLSTELKNREYKGAIAHVLRDMGCPLDRGRKVGFSANPDQDITPESSASSPTEPIGEAISCPPPSFDLEGIPKNALRDLHLLYPSCPSTTALYTTHLLSTEGPTPQVLSLYLSLPSQHHNTAAYTLFSNYHLTGTFNFCVRANATQPLTTLFLANSPLFTSQNHASFYRTPRGIEEMNSAAEAMLKYLSASPPPPPALRELAAYAYACLAHNFLSLSPEKILKDHVLSSVPLEGVVESSRPPTLSQYQFHAGGLTPIKLATVATSPTSQLLYLMKSSPLPIDVLGLGQPWEGNPTKVHLYLEYVKSLPPDQLVLTFDAYDVLLSPEVEFLPHIYSNIAGSSNKTIFSGEVRCWPDASLSSLYPNSTAPFPYLNSGAYLGRAVNLVRILSEVATYPSLEVSDQRAFQRYYLTNPTEIIIDDTGSLFRTLHMAAHNIAFDGDGFITPSSRPVLIHGNGQDGQKAYETFTKTIFRNLQGSLTESSVHSLLVGSNAATTRDNIRLMCDLMMDSNPQADPSPYLHSFIVKAAEMARAGAYTEACKVLFLAHRAARALDVQSMAKLALREFAVIFLGEGSVFALRPSRDPIGVLRSWVDGVPGRYWTSDESWLELSRYNLGIALWWSGESEACKETYLSIVESRPKEDRLFAMDSEGAGVNIAAVATEEREGLKMLLESASIAGVEVDVLGMGDHYEGNHQKVRYFLDYVRGMDPGSLVLFVDAYDVLLFGDVRDIEGAWKEAGKAVLFAGETASYPDLGASLLYDSDVADFPYLNSCAFVGRADAVRSMLEEVASYPSLSVSDQRAFVRYALRNPDLVAVDSAGLHLSTLHGVEESCVVVDGRASVGTRSGLALIHGNAGGMGGKRFHSEIYAALSSGGGTVDPPAYAMAVAMYKRGEREAAEGMFVRAIEADGDFLDARYNLGVVRAEMGDAGGSEEAYEGCLEVDQAHQPCLLNLAVLKMNGLGDFVGAVDLLKRALAVEERGREQMIRELLDQAEAKSSSSKIHG